MPITEVVETLTMVPPAVDAPEPRICSPSFKEEPLMAGTSGLTCGRLQRPQGRRAGDHPLIGVGLVEPQRRRPRAVRLCVFRYGVALKSIPLAVWTSWELASNSLLACNQARRAWSAGSGESCCQRCGQFPARPGRTRDGSRTRARHGCRAVRHGSRIAPGRRLRAAPDGEPAGPRSPSKTFVSDVSAIDPQRYGGRPGRSALGHRDPRAARRAIPQALPRRTCCCLV